MRITVAGNAGDPQEAFVEVETIGKEEPEEVVRLTEAVKGKSAFCFWLRITDNEDYHFIRSMTVTVNSVPAT